MSKLLMTYKHLSQAEKHKIHALIKAGHDQSEIAKLPERHASAISRELSRNTGSRAYRPKQACEMSKANPWRPIKTMSFDNGKEFAVHAHIDEQLQYTKHFARQFTSWEHGCNENFNGLLLQYIPNKRSMSTVTDKEIRMIQYRLNNMPRKRLKHPQRRFINHSSALRFKLESAYLHFAYQLT